MARGLLLGIQLLGLRLEYERPRPRRYLCYLSRWLGKDEHSTILGRKAFQPLIGRRCQVVKNIALAVLYVHYYLLG